MKLSDAEIMYLIEKQQKIAKFPDCIAARIIAEQTISALSELLRLRKGVPVEGVVR